MRGGGGEVQESGFECRGDGIGECHFGGVLCGRMVVEVCTWRCWSVSEVFRGWVESRYRV